MKTKWKIYRTESNFERRYDIEVRKYKKEIEALWNSANKVRLFSDFETTHVEGILVKDKMSEKDNNRENR